MKGVCVNSFSQSINETLVVPEGGRLDLCFEPGSGRASIDVVEAYQAGSSSYDQCYRRELSWSLPPVLLPSEWDEMRVEMEPLLNRILLGYSGQGEQCEAEYSDDALSAEESIQSLIDQHESSFSEPYRFMQAVDDGFLPELKFHFSQNSTVIAVTYADSGAVFIDANTPDESLVRHVDFYLSVDPSVSMFAAMNRDQFLIDLRKIRDEC